MNELELLVDLHKNNYRQGPGSTDTTLQALKFIEIKNIPNLKILDVGCGTGAQTIDLALNINGTIIAVDFLKPFLDILNQNSQQKGLSQKISTLESSMDDMPFGKNEFDIIWSEGAIYNMGFENGVKAWRQFLKEDGYLAVSEISWLTETRPKEIEEHWNNAYPEIDTISNKIKVLENNGYAIVSCFTLPESCWLDNYYKPMQDKFDAFLANHNNSKNAISIVEDEKKEISLYEKYKNYLNYGFYIAKKMVR